MALLNQFVPVRLVNFKGVDMNLFRFDYDLTFAALMMNADGYTYSRFGTQDHTGTTDRMSLAGLKQAMRAVLAAHRAGQVNRANLPDPSQRRLLEDIPAFARSKRRQEACYHCHYASEFQIRQLRAEGRFRKEMVFRYPYPENIGVTLKVDANNVVSAVQPGSPAAKVGLRPGDVILRAGETPVFTAADLQFALDSVPDPGSIMLRASRNGQALPPMTLSLPRYWRKTDVSWRASQGTIPPIMGFWGRKLNEQERRQRGLPADRLALLANFMFPGPQWEKTRGGLRHGDVVIAVNGQALPDLNMRQFHSYFRLNFNVGDTVTVTVLRGGERVDLTVPCLEVKEE